MQGRGANGNKILHGFTEENHVQYGSSALPQLQLFGHDPMQYGAGISTANYTGNEQVPPVNLPIKRVREGEPLFFQPKLPMPLSNSHNQDKAVNIGTFLNHNPVSTGLRLSCDEDEHYSSVSSACESTRNALPGALSIGNIVKTEIDRHNEEIAQYIKLQEENMLKGVKELNQRHTVTLLNALQNGVNKKLHEKDLEIVNMNRMNKELDDRIKQVAIEAQSWHYRAKYNESLVNVLKGNIQQQLMVQGTAQAREGLGESEVNDAVSCTNHQVVQHRNPKCRACKGKEVSVLLLPCRHLCLCVDCEGFVDICPVCQVMKNASVRVCM